MVCCKADFKRMRLEIVAISQESLVLCVKLTFSFQLVQTK